MSELVKLLSKSEARALTEKIRTAGNGLAEMLYEANKREAWRVLDYSDWKSYITGEFQMSERYSYRLLDFIEVKTALSTGPGASPENEKQVRPLKGLPSELKGRLIDGQHRLYGVIKSNTPVEMVVSTGVPASKNGDVNLFTMDVIDNGRKRTVSDQLALCHGVKNATMTASAARVIATICHPGSQKAPLTIGPTTQLLNIFGEEIATMISVVGGFKPGRRAGVLGTMAFCYCAAPKLVLDFAEKLAHGEGIKRGDPVFAYRNHIINHPIRSGGNEIIPNIQLAANALYNHVHNNPLTMMKVGANGIEFFRSKLRIKVQRVCEIFGGQ